MNAPTKTFSGDVGALLKLVLPLILTGFLESSVGFFSTFFLAHLGARELAAGAAVQWLFFTMMVVSWGLLTSISVLVAHKYGEKNLPAISTILRDSMFLGIIVLIPIILILRNIYPILVYAGQEPATAALAQSYMSALSWGIPGDLLGLILMQFLIGLGHARTSMFFTMFWVPLNIISNYVLIFGKFGFPALGMAGIGWGTALAYTAIAVVLTIYILLKKDYRKYLDGIFTWSKPQFLGELCSVGLPMGMMYAVEVAFFLTLTLIMGHYGIAQVAGNQITLQYLGQVSVVSFGVAQAVSVRMGHTLGAGQPMLAERAVYAGMLLALSFMLVVAFVYNFFPLALIGIDMDINAEKNSAIITYATQFMAVGALFQVIESIRFSLFGALRGLKDTNFTLWVSILSFWGISLPVGYIFATVLKGAGVGYWWGTIVGQLCAMAILYLRFRAKMAVINPEEDPLAA
jgi:MATE family multidrug resistance protein